MRRAAIWFGAILSCSGCAVQEAPSGGPEDKTPPRIVSVFPSADSAGVSRDVRPVFVFSERIDGESFKNRLLVHPPLTFDRVSAKGERLEISFKTLLPETTICLTLMPGYRDVHREAPAVEARVLCFSTTDSIARGEIRGAVFFKGKPDSAGAVELFHARKDSLTELATTKRARVAFAERDGRFAIRALPTNDARFLLRGFIDKDGDGFFSDGKEFGLIYPDTIVLSPLSPLVEEVAVMVIDPNEPGVLKGVVANESGIAAPPVVRLDPLARGGKWLFARADSSGAFVVSRVPPGEYLFSAFVDVNPDSLCGRYRDEADSTKVLEEPCVSLSDTLRLKPGEIRTLDPVTLK
jgi:hypothetical protein